MANRYSFQNFEKGKHARAFGSGLPLSTKQCIEISSYLRKKKVEYAKRILEDAIDEKKAIPYKRFNGDVGHKPGIGAGRYPKKACKEILKLLNSAESNAMFIGLDVSSLIIESINANKASAPMRYGRQRGRTSKRTHVEIILTESQKKKKQAKKATEEKPKETKSEKKPETPAKVEKPKAEKPVAKEPAQKPVEKKPEQSKEAKEDKK